MASARLPPSARAAGDIVNAMDALSLLWAGHWVWLLLPLAALGITIVNLVSWPTGKGRRRATGAPVSVLIPARNEERTIEAAVRSALREPVAEVVVCDDRSTDATPRILASIDDPRLRVVTGEPLAAGWVGKAHACARLAREASTEQLLFLDADTTLRAGALERLWRLRASYDADAVTALPHQVMGTLGEKLLLPMLHVTYTSWLPLFLVHRTPWKVFLAANGQVLFLSRDALSAAGGFEGIRREVVDDMALCRNLKAAGRRVVFAEGSAIASCRMYHSARDLWEGFAKNLYEGLGSVPMLLLTLCVYGGAFLVPWALLVLAVRQPDLWLPAVIGLGANGLQRSLLAHRFEHSWWSVVVHPFAVVGLLLLALDSCRRSYTGQIAWKGRHYAARNARG